MARIGSLSGSTSKPLGLMCYARGKEVEDVLVEPIGDTCEPREFLWLLNEKKRPDEEREEDDLEEALEGALLHFMFLKYAIEEALVSMTECSLVVICV